MLHEPTLMPDKAGTVTDQRDRAFLPMEALTQLESDHEPLVPWMFQQLSQAHSRLAHVIECATGSQMRAALRMERRRKRLGGDTAYHALSRGEDKLVWDAVASMDR